jgi:hypothetical protein
MKREGEEITSIWVGELQLSSVFKAYVRALVGCNINSIALEKRKKISNTIRINNKSFFLSLWELLL